MMALTFDHGAVEEAQEYARWYGLTLDVLKPGSVPYREMPALLRRYQVYVDVKRGPHGILPALSLTALQAKACGLGVVRWDGQVSLNEPYSPKDIPVRPFRPRPPQGFVETFWRTIGRIMEALSR